MTDEEGRRKEAIAKLLEEAKRLAGERPPFSQEGGNAPLERDLQNNPSDPYDKEPRCG